MAREGENCQMSSRGCWGNKYTHTLSLSLQRTLLSVHGRRKTSMYCRQL